MSAAPIDHAELARLCAVATPGPWQHAAWTPYDGEKMAGVVCVPGRAHMPLFAVGKSTLEDCDFIAAARTAVPQLLAEIALLRAALSALVEALPKCDACDAPATRAFARGQERYCDAEKCEPRCFSAVIPEYPRAAPLRHAIALLTQSTAPTRKATP